MRTKDLRAGDVVATVDGKWVFFIIDTHEEDAGGPSSSISYIAHWKSAVGSGFGYQRNLRNTLNAYFRRSDLCWRFVSRIGDPDATGLKYQHGAGWISEEQDE